MDINKIQMADYEHIRSLESIVFILGTAWLIFICAGLGLYFIRKIGTSALIQTKYFNKDIFMRDRALFEHYGEKDVLETRDLLALARDKRFIEHLWRKEVSYYEKLMTIVQTVKLLQFLRWGGILLLAVCSYLGYLMAIGVYKK